MSGDSERPRFRTPAEETLWINRWKAEDPESLDKLIALYEGTIAELRIAKARGLTLEMGPDRSGYLLEEEPE